MKFYPSNTLEKFEFDLVKEDINQQCVSILGKTIVNDLVPSSNFRWIIKELKFTNEFITILSNRYQFPLDGFEQVTPFLNLFEKGNYTADTTQLEKVRSLTKAFQDVLRFLKRFKEEEEIDFPTLRQVVTSIEFEKAIINHINTVLTNDGKVKNKASDVLFVIRKEQEENRVELNKVFQAALQKSRKAGHLADIQETMRHGRRVLAVRSEYKRKVKGIIHDISESGQTSFIEPQSALQLSNELLNLEQDERVEIHRILNRLTAKIRPYTNLLRQYEAILASIDFTRAKAKYALSIDGIIPDIVQEPKVELIDAFHPVLKDQNQKNEKLTIPLTFELNQSQRIIIISGPNAGGKSVALKTVGLLQLMIQSGIPVPVGDSSVMGVFSNLLSEIGDEQSIQDELSTYSSKLTKMKYFLANSDANSLFLIDEFGSGTDPNLGGAVAQSILEDLLKKKSFGVITTHYLNLKTYANKTDAVANAAMLFNETNLKPLYQLEIGKPGSSYTFSIAKTTGLPDKVIARAKQISSSSQLDLEDLLTTTNQSKSEIALQELELQSKQRSFETKEEELKQLKKRLKAEREKYTINKKEQELKIKVEVKKQFDDYVKQLSKIENKQHGAQQINEQLKNELKTTKDIIQKKKRNKTNKEAKPSQKEFKIGDPVKWIQNDQVGTILDIKKKKATVAFGSIKTMINKDDLIKLTDEPIHKKAKTKIATKISKEPESIHFEIDLRGMRYEEAEKELTVFLDKAILSNISWLKVLHGKGSGVLRNLTKDVAKRYNAKKISHPHFEEGGDGISILSF